MDNKFDIQGTDIGGLSDFIRGFFEELKSSPEFDTLTEQPFATPEGRTNLFNYLNMGLIEKYLRILKGQNLGDVDTFMSNGLEWVNGMVAKNSDGVKEGNAKVLIHLYVNLLALLAGAPTIFMKIGALTMYSIAPDTTKGWL